MLQIFTCRSMLASPSVLCSRACLRPLLSDCNFKIGGKVIEFVSSYSHLGHVVNDSLYDGPDISKRQGDFIGQVNSVLCDFRQLPSIVKYRLFSSYCTSFYGSELWHLSNAKLVNFGITWRKSVRKIWNLPNTAHCNLIPLLCGFLPFQDEICRRFLHFVYKCMFSAVAVVRSVAHYAVTYGRNHSPLGRNLLVCMNRYKCSLCDIFRPNISRIHGFIVERVFNYNTVSSLQPANFLRECAMVRDGLLTLPN